MTLERLNKIEHVLNKFETAFETTATCADLIEDSLPAREVKAIKKLNKESVKCGIIDAFLDAKHFLPTYDLKEIGYNDRVDVVLYDFRYNKTHKFYPTLLKFAQYNMLKVIKEELEKEIKEEFEIACK